MNAPPIGGVGGAEGPADDVVAVDAAGAQVLLPGGTFCNSFWKLLLETSPVNSPGGHSLRLEPPSDTAPRLVAPLKLFWA